MSTPLNGRPAASRDLRAEAEALGGSLVIENAHPEIKTSD